jgi:hypothetical protein
MTITNISPETQAAIDMLYGSRDTAAVAAEEASPIAQAVAAAAQQLQLAREGELDSKRLAEAMHLVLSHSVTLNLDGSSTVQSGKRVYSQRGDTCSCPDYQHRQSFCKHLMAVELYRLAQALLKDNAAGEAPALPAASVSASAAWDVHEAPVSCYLKFRVGHLELSYTMRDVDDNHLASRLTQVLPKVNAMIEAEEARRQQLAAERAAAKQQASKPAASPADADNVQQLVQQAVQQALAQGGSGAEPPRIRHAANGQAEHYNDDGDKWCAIHGEWMPERSNDKGSWHSHPAADEQGEYYCKGNGRQRRSR